MQNAEMKRVIYYICVYRREEWTISLKMFISGGCKNGKSYFAQRFSAMHGGPRYYIATMKPSDAEDGERIARHRYEREGWGFITVEQHTRIEDILDKCDTGGSFLLDSLTALLANEMFAEDGSIDKGAADRISGGLARVIDKIVNIAIVSDYIYSDAVLYDPATEMYRRSLAAIDRMAASLCDAVVEVSFGCLTVHKGKDLLRSAGVLPADLVQQYSRSAQ